MKRSILLVDGNVKAARAMARDLSADTGWDVSVVSNATEALVVLRNSPCAAIVTELRLPGTDGEALLNEVIKRHPDVHRLILADLNDKMGLLKCVGKVHQFIAKPGSHTILKEAINRLFSFDIWLPGQQVQSLLTRLVRLPSPPDLFFRIVREMQSPNCMLDDVGQLIAQDMAISAKLLQLVNSASFGLSEPISSPTEAVSHLGIETTKALVMLAHCFSYLAGIKGVNFSSDDLWQHAVRVGGFARTIARAEQRTHAFAECCYTAGLLHDIGKLAIVANLPAEYAQAVSLVRAEGISSSDAETRILGASHAEIGAALLATWGLSPDIVEALALHHHPARLVNNGFCPLTAVHVANAIDKGIRQKSEPRIDIEYLTELKLAERVATWKEVCISQVQEQESQIQAA